MKEKFKRFSDWCNVHHGLILFCTGIVAIIGIILENLHLNINLLLPIEMFIGLLTNNLEIPIYLILILLLITLQYLRGIKNKYKKVAIKFNFLVGKWQLDWEGTINGIFQGDSERGEFTTDEKYFDDKGTPCFDIKDFQYNELSHTITFNKVDIQPNNNRENLINVLHINSNNNLTGEELGINTNVKVKYIRIS